MNPGLLSTLMIGAVVVVLVPVLLGAWFARRWRASWIVFLYGALVFFVFQVLTRIPALEALGPAVSGLLRQSAWYKYAWFLFLAFTAGLFEEGGRYLGYRFLWKNQDKTWPQALMYGAGHGGVEALLLAGLPLLGSLVSCIYAGLTDPATLPADQALLLYQTRETCAITGWWIPLVGMVERLMAITVHLSLSVLVLQVFTRGKGYWWWLAVGYHTLTNLVAILVAEWTTTVLPTWGVILATEGAVLLFALFSLWMIWRLRPRELAEPPAEPAV